MKRYFSKFGQANHGIAAFISVPLTILLIAVLSLGLVFSFSPVVGSLLIRKLFDTPPQLPPDDLSYSDQVTVTNNIAYGGAKDEVLDLYLPKEADGVCPLIVWVHGGAFVGGDKRDVTYFAQALAGHGYAVAVINYTRAPEAKYPTPVLQTGKAYRFLTETYEAAENLDTTRVFFAGDSAGAHIAAQFMTLQTNEAYREAFLAAHDAEGFPLITKDMLKGVLLYCGPYSVERMVSVTNPLMKFLVSQTGWAYFGSKKFGDTPAGKEANLVEHVTSAFPPSFITDGNFLTFPDHAKELVERLTEQGVPVQTLFFDGELEVVEHEFQFDLKEDAGRLALEQTLEFLSKRLLFK